MTFSIAKLNRLPKEERDSAYLRLVPEAIFEMFQIDCQTLMNPFGEKVVTGIFPPDENFACIEVKHRAGDRDCIFSCQVSLEAFMQSLYLDFLIINNPFSERFNVDVDEQGRDTLLGTRSRNIPEEVRAMEAGLAPGNGQAWVTSGERICKVSGSIHGIVGAEDHHHGCFFLSQCHIVGETWIYLLQRR